MSSREMMALLYHRVVRPIQSSSSPMTTSSSFSPPPSSPPAVAAPPSLLSAAFLALSFSLLFNFCFRFFSCLFNFSASSFSFAARSAASLRSKPAARFFLSATRAFLLFRLFPPFFSSPSSASLPAGSPCLTHALLNFPDAGSNTDTFHGTAHPGHRIAAARSRISAPLTAVAAYASRCSAASAESAAGAK